MIATLHDLTLAAEFADRVLILSEGRILADGPPDTALTEANLARAFQVRARDRPLRRRPPFFLSPLMTKVPPMFRLSLAALLLSATAALAFPVTVKSCDREVTFDAPPARAISQ